MKNNNLVELFGFAAGAFFISLGYLLPYGVGPLNTFPMEALSAIGWVLMAGSFFLKSGRVERLSRPAGLLLLLPALLASYAVVDMIIGRNEYGARLALYLLHMSIAAAAAWFGLQVGIQHRGDAAKTCLKLIAIAIVIASALNGVAAFTQFFEMRLPQWIVVKLTDVRPYGNIRQPNLYALLLAFGVIALTGLAQMIHKLPRIAWLGLALLATFIGLASSLSASRTGLVFAAIIGGSVWIGSTLNRRAKLIATSGSIATFAGWIAFTKLNLSGAMQYAGAKRMDISTGADFTSRRTELWSAMVDLIEKHPLIGSGYSRLNYDYFFLDTPAPLGFNLQNAHNLPLHLAVEHGVPLAILWLAVLGILVWAIRKTWFQPIPKLFWIGLLMVGVHSCLELPLWYLYFLLPTSFALGVVSGYANAQNQNQKGESSKIARRGTVLAVTFACLLAIFGVWRDYNRILPIFLGSNDEAMSRLEEGYKTIFFTAWMDYAVVANTPVTPENAKLHYRISKRVSTFVIQNFVVMNLALSSSMLGRPDEAAFYLKRLKGIYGKDFESALAKLTPAELDILKPALVILYSEGK